MTTIRAACAAAARYGEPTITSYILVRAGVCGDKLEGLAILRDAEAAGYMYRRSGQPPRYGLTEKGRREAWLARTA